LLSDSDGIKWNTFDKIKKSVGDFEQNEELYRFALWTARSLADCILMHKGACLWFRSFVPSSRSHFVTVKWSCAIHIYDARTVQLTDLMGARVLFREVKDTSRGSVLKMHWIRTIESFYLGQLLRRNDRNESVWGSGWTSREGDDREPQPPRNILQCRPV